MANLKIELVKSLNGRSAKQIATANSLGLRKIGIRTDQSCFILGRIVRILASQDTTS